MQESFNFKPVYHKNLEPIVYVVGEMAGRAPGEAVLDMMKKLEKNPVQDNININWAGEGELIMMAIPLTILGIMPGFYILNFFTENINGFSDPVFFTATSMIGMIALGGITTHHFILMDKAPETAY